MKAHLFIKQFITFATAIFMVSAASAQAIGNWTFNNTLSGTPGSSNTVTAAVLGPGITTGAYNGGTVYYGEGGWTSSAVLDPNDYLEFSLTPTAGNNMSISSIVFNIRRSTTGTPSGSGPNNWSLRSSLDGFSTDVYTSALSTSSTPSITVAMPAAFTSLNSTVTFRVYGFNATVTSGGLNRFVFDNITANGLVVLPVHLTSFNGMVKDNIMHLTWTMDGAADKIIVERSQDGIAFNAIANVDATGNHDHYYYDDASAKQAGAWYYRIHITLADGTDVYSHMVKSSTGESEHASLTVMSTRKGTSMKIKMISPEAKNIQFGIYTFSGQLVRTKNIAVEVGSNSIDLGVAPAISGIYIVTATSNGIFYNAKVVVE